MENILALIPQRPPFVMIDELLFSDSKVTRSTFKIRKENIFVENDELAEAGLMENIAQTAAAAEGYISMRNNEPAHIGYIGAVHNLEVFFLPKVDGQLITQIKITEQVFNARLIEGAIFCNELLVASCEMKVFITKKHN